MFPWGRILCLATWVVMTSASYPKCKVFTTFAASLGADVRDADSRLGPITEALKYLNTDFLCLQDIWFESEMHFILQGLRHRFPHHYSKLHSDLDELRPPVSCVDALYEPSRIKDISCTREEAIIIDALSRQCDEEKGCNLLPGLNREICIALQCQHIWNRDDITEDCISCIFQEHGLPEGEGLRRCSQPFQHLDNRVNGPGLLLLSKSKLLSATYTSFFPDNKAAYQKGYIEAILSDGAKVVCTQMSGLFQPYLEYDLPFTSYEEESRAEVLTLLQEFGNEDTILMGDFNIGPVAFPSTIEERNLVGEAPENYRLLTDSGFSSPYMQVDGRCTLCEHNPWNPKLDNRNWRNNVLDHVMIKNNSRYVSFHATRVLDTQPLSDHYGVLVKLCET